MQDHYSFSDEKFQHAFETCGLHPKYFSHEAHIRLAWIYISNYGLSKAEEKLCQAIKRYDAFYGDGSKFNKTVTVAATKAVYHFMQKSKALNFKAFIHEFPRLKFEFKALMSAHYGFDIYANEQAKTSYLQPDLLPFT